MSRRLSNFAKGTCYHGYAGIASAFVALADKKLKPGGVLALVLPMSVAAGFSWQGFRQLLTGNYWDVEVLSIASDSGNDNDMSFSSDTGMGECLVIAKRRVDRKLAPAQSGINFASLQRRPQGFAAASAIANEILNVNVLRNIVDGPYGGTDVSVGDHISGGMLRAAHSDSSETWGCVRLQDYSIAQTAYALSNSSLWLPAQPTSNRLYTVLLKEIGNRGWHDINIAGSKAPFTKGPPSDTATYPSLWNHDAKAETRLIRKTDSQLHVRHGMETKAAEVWATASRTHASRGFRFNSQPLGVAFTEQQTVGGRAWPNVSFDDKRFEYAFVIWGNCTLGLLSYWWHASRQQGGRGEMSVSSVDTLPVLDFRTLSDQQLATAERIFDEFRELDLMPAYLADADPNRALLDRRVICDLLGFDEDIYLGVRRLAARSGAPSPPSTAARQAPRTPSTRSE